MSDDRRPYTVVIGGVEHTMLLNEADAAKYGDMATEVRAKAAPKPANKARTPRNKSK